MASKSLKALLKDPDFRLLEEQNPTAAREIFESVGTQDPAWQRLPPLAQQRLKDFYLRTPGESSSQAYSRLREESIGRLPGSLTRAAARFIVPESLGGAAATAVAGPAGRLGSAAARYGIPPAVALGTEMLAGAAHPFRAAFEGAGAAGGTAIGRALASRAARKGAPALTEGAAEALTKKVEFPFREALMHDTGLKFKDLGALRQALDEKPLQRLLGPQLQRLENLATKEAGLQKMTTQLPTWIVAKSQPAVNAIYQRAMRKGQDIGDMPRTVTVPEMFKLRRLWQEAGRGTGERVAGRDVREAASALDGSITSFMDQLTPNLGGEFADTLRKYGRAVRWDNLLYKTGFLERGPGAPQFNWKGLLTAINKDPRKYGISSLPGFQGFLAAGGAPGTAPRMLPPDVGGTFTRIFHKGPFGTGISHFARGAPQAPRLALTPGMGGAAATAAPTGFARAPQLGRAAATGLAEFAAPPEPAGEPGAGPPTIPLGLEEGAAAEQALQGLR